MVEEQLRARDVADERVLQAMARVPRERFVAPSYRDRAYDDVALPIGEGQTISQPYMVARICEALSLRGNERVLDVGAGSGYQAAVLAELAEEVHTIERLPGLVEHASTALAAAGYDRVQLHLGDGTLGLSEHAPFQAIAVAAAAPEVPPALYEQLEPAGRLVVRSAGGTARSSCSSSAARRDRPCCARSRAGSSRSSASRASTVADLRRAWVRVEGRVQGVGFRASAYSRARSLQVAGWVRNNADGSLEAELEGPRDRVESLLDWFGRGPRGADIDAVQVEWRKPVGEALFTIR